MGNKLTHTVSGRIASFRSADKTNITHLKAHFLPIQEGTGDPSPSNIRPITGWTNLNVKKAGGNLLDSTLWPSTRNMRYIKYTTGTAPEWSGSYNASDFIPIVGGADYVLHAGFYTQDEGGMAFYTDADVSTYISGIVMNNSTKKEYQFTAPENANYMRFCNLDSIMEHADVWLEGGTGAGTRDTYNITNFPITFPAVGKNLLDEETYGIPYDTSMCFGRTSNTYADNMFLKAGTYTISSDLTADMIVVTNSAGKQLNGVAMNTTYHTFTLTQDDNVGILFYKMNMTANEFLSYHYQLEAGPTATSYEPFDNTVYGGYIDLVTGNIVATYQKYTFTSGFYSYAGNSTYNGEYGTNRIHSINIKSGGLCWGDKVTKSSTSTWSTPDNYIWKFCTNGKAQLHVVFDNATVGITSDMDYAQRSTKINAWVAENPLTFVLPLEEPIVIATINPQQFETIKGSNNIWNTTNGNTEVEYEFTDYMNKCRISLNEPHIITNSDGIGSFWTDLSAPIESLKIGFHPVQSGTGNPTLTNVREVSGRTSTTALYSKKNILNPSLKKWSDIYDVQKWGMEKSGSATTGELILPQGTYTLSISGLASNVNPSEWKIVDSDGNKIAHYYAGRKYVTFTLKCRTEIGIYMSIANTEENRYCLHNNVMLEANSAATGFEEYTTTTIPISWTEQGEILGGYVDLITGAIYKSWEKVMLTENATAWSAWGTKLMYTTGYMSNGPYSSNHGARKPKSIIYSNILTPIGSNIDPQKATDTTEIRYYGIDDRYRQYFFMANPNELSVADWRAWFNETYADAYIVYEKEEPTLIGYLTPTQMKSLIGYNTIWTPDGADVIVNYWGHK